MSADEAFDKLMTKNALLIPVVKRPGDTDSSRSGTSASGRIISAETAVPGADYSPAASSRSAAPSGRSIYSRPTATDLDAVDAEEPDQNGGRMEADGIPGLEDDGAGGPDAPLLGLARRVRRFSYIPLEGMETFERHARETAAALVSQNPGRPSLAVTSAARGEGRTELCIRFALALARRVGYRILLADFDIRNPRAAARLGVSSSFFTLTDVLRGACPLGEALAASEEDNLYLLPSRPTDRDGDEVLDSRQAENLVEEMHTLFDFIVFDCGPVGRADAALMCRLAGSAALAGYCGRTSITAVNAAARRLTETGANFAGLLLTGAH